MACQFLRKIPCEIRLKIYGIVLDFGRVTLQDPDELSETDKPKLVTYNGDAPTTNLCLGILQTCKQIFRECQGLFWRINTLQFNADLFGNADFINSLFTSWDKLQRIEIQLEFNDHHFADLKLAMQPLAALSRRGNLKEIQLTVSSPSVGRIRDGFHCVIQFGPKSPPEYTKLRLHDIVEVLWKGFNRSGGLLSHVKRSLHLCLELDKMRPSELEDYLWELRSPNAEYPLKIMHAYLRGDLFVDGNLCYRNGRRIRESFKIQDENGHLIRATPKGQPEISKES